MITNGSMEAAAMLFAHLVEPGARVAVEQPSYDRTLLLLRQLGAELVPLPLEADGLDVGALETALSDGPIALAHVIPNFHNPAGCTLSAAKRERLVELAAEHGFWLFEDDPYRELPFEGETLPTMLSQDGADRVIHASSFSKTVSPGVRVGYLAGPKEEIAKLAKRANQTYISPNMLAESVVLELCRSGALERNIEFVKGALRERRDALVECARRADPRSRFRDPRRRLLPLARPRAGDRHAGAPRRGEGGRRSLRRRAGLHARRRRGEPSPLLCQRSTRADRRGDREDRGGPGAGARCGARLSRAKTNRKLRVVYRGFSERPYGEAMDPRKSRPAPADAERRLADLAAAIRDHEDSIRRNRPLGMRAPDDYLYRRLRQICGER